MSAGGLLRTARDGAVRYVRMTREDAVQLSDVFLQVARRQAKDALHAAPARAARARRSLVRALRRPPR